MSEKAAATGNTDLSKLTVEELRDAYLVAEDYIAKLKSQQAEILEAVSTRVKGDLERAFAETGKPTGSLTQNVAKVGFKYEVTKKVEWDTEKLKGLFALMPDKAPEIVDVKMSIPEKKFDGLSMILEKDSEAHKAIMAARTVTIGVPKISFVK